ncbi:protein kinase, putative [Phytophthora infestans T30-4]|uniref:Protein kinase, putative n=1 Tax=Phytophthora infestans (strain T30-4) TaxID=403677 RepID=D0NUD1_PHYIT|nr:protein kinase, putative [Phytophthora infestans T30-4]EEY65264.1 protein kinase, putative [Phytophthora infestans T30-4]|eukprot:XP_002897328.1 protein kinase, putative [Phytophthora infestans T30-4]
MSGRASIGDYVVTSKLGSGSFAVVYKGYHKVSKTPVAIKALSLHKLNSKLLSNLEMEISIMRQIDHPNVVKLYDIKKTEKHMYLVLEYCAGGDLQHYMRRRQQQSGGNLLPESVARHFLRELAKGMQCLWQHNLIHRDLKPQNLLLVEDSATSALKIADFGFARHLATASMAETLCGSPLYMAPEILKFQKYDAKADLWSVGTILFEMLAGRPPYGGANHVQLLANIERQPLRFPPTLQLSRPCRQLLVALLQRKPALRLGFAEFFADPFVDLQPLPEQIEEAEATRRSSTLSTTASIREEEDEQGTSERWGVSTAGNSRTGATDAENSSTPRRGAGSDRRSRAFSVSHESSSSSRTVPSTLLRQSRSGNLEVMETAFASASSGSGALRRSSSSRLARSRRASSSGSGLAGVNAGTSPKLSPQMSPHILPSPSPRINPFKQLSESPPGATAAQQQLSLSRSKSSQPKASDAVVTRPKNTTTGHALDSSGEYVLSFSREYGQQLIDIVVLRTQAIAPIADQLWTLSGSGDISSGSGTENASEPVTGDWSPQQTENNSSSSGGKRASVNFSTVFSMSSSLASSIGVSNALAEDEDDDDDDDEKRTAERQYVYAAEALALYVKCLRLVQHVVLYFRHEQTSRGSMGSSGSSGASGWSETSRKVSMAFLSEQLTHFLDRAEQCKTRMARLRSPTRSIASQEELLYAHALRLGRQGAIREVLGQTRAAHDHYLQALLLLESLLMDVHGAALAVDDQKNVNNFLRALEQRLKNVRSLLDDENSSAAPSCRPQQVSYRPSATAAVL